MSDVTDQQFLDAGVSRAKLRTMRSLSDEIISKELSLRRLSRQSDEIVFEQLTRIKGIGPWSVQMYQMFVLGSPDIFPESDTGILNAMNRLYRSKRGNAADIASQWSPYRTVACWYLWRYLDSARNGVE
jgi:DNA-3-methyladenine glycosylase II